MLSKAVTLFQFAKDVGIVLGTLARNVMRSFFRASWLGISLLCLSPASSLADVQQTLLSQMSDR